MGAKMASCTTEETALPLATLDAYYISPPFRLVNCQLQPRDPRLSSSSVRMIKGGMCFLPITAPLTQISANTTLLLTFRQHVRYIEERFFVHGTHPNLLFDERMRLRYRLGCHTSRTAPH